MNMRHAIDRTTASAVEADVRTAELFGRLASLESEQERHQEALQWQRYYGARAALGRRIARARQAVVVDCRTPGTISTTDEDGTRTSVAPGLICWYLAATIISAFAEAGPHAHCIAAKSTDLVGPKNPATALRNHLERAASHLERDGHTGLARWLLAVVCHRDGRITLDRESAPRLELLV
jgi:hypothetical protein